MLRPGARLFALEPSSVRSARRGARPVPGIAHEFAVSAYVQDALSTLYVLRALKLKAGDSMTIPITDSGTSYSAKFDIAGPEAVTAEQEMRIALICAEAVRLCWRAVEGHLFPTAGSSAVRAGERIERVWRDMSMFRTHAGVAVFLAALAPRELSKARFGNT